MKFLFNTLIIINRYKNIKGGVRYTWSPFRIIRLPTSSNNNPIADSDASRTNQLRANPSIQIRFRYSKHIFQWSYLNYMMIHTLQAYVWMQSYSEIANTSIYLNIRWILSYISIWYIWLDVSFVNNRVFKVLLLKKLGTNWENFINFKY